MKCMLGMISTTVFDCREADCFLYLYHGEEESCLIAETMRAYVASTFASSRPETVIDLKEGQDMGEALQKALDKKK